ncbi:MAG: hypothetical protein FWF03_03305 [Defluviitaleaceae bacterium]|nr:hypothetical protein [Defluviitaleaceae bacterium]
MIETVKRETLRSRERVIKAVNHEEADRIPIDLGFHYSTGISAFAYKNLRDYLGLPDKPIEIIDINQFLARVDTDVLERFHCDAVLLNPGAASKKAWNPRGNYVFQIPADCMMERQSDGAWAKISQSACYMPEGGFFFDAAPQAPSDEDEHIARYAKEAERIFKDSDYYTMYIGYGAYFDGTNADSLCKMLTDPGEFVEDMAYAHKRQMRSLRKVIGEMGGYIQAVALNADLGSQAGPLCGPELYAKLCAPFVREFCDYVHQNSDVKVFIHSCGSIKRFMKILIECGVDIFNPVQINAAEMDPASLKDEFGTEAVFWGGGCDTQKVLGCKTPEQVAANVKELTGVFKPGGGFVFNQVHNIMGNVPPENIVAMLDAAYGESFY